MKLGAQHVSTIIIIFIKFYLYAFGVQLYILPASFLPSEIVTQQHISTYREMEDVELVIVASSIRLHITGDQHRVIRPTASGLVLYVVAILLYCISCIKILQQQWRSIAYTLTYELK